jgi:hypothetical protein
MKVSFSAGAITLLSFTRPVLTATYPLSDAIVGSDFYKAFNFEAISDPSHGRVYVFFLLSSFTSLPRLTCPSLLCGEGGRTHTRSLTSDFIHV